MEILEEIIETKGDCLKVERCNKCPFWERCWYDMIHESTPTQEFRLRLAEQALFHKIFLDADLKWPIERTEYNVAL